MADDTAIHTHSYRIVNPIRRLFEFSIAYIDSAIDICDIMRKDDDRATWPNASVALMLAAHSSELFLKAAIALRTRAILATHDLEALLEAYRVEYGLEFPFFLPLTSINGGVSAEDRAMLRRARAVEDPSIIYRYPFLDLEREWRGIHQVTPVGLRRNLCEARENMVNEYMRLLPQE